MSTPLCLGCGQEVRFNKDRRWETEDGGTTCTGGGPHRVGQVIPDPPESCWASGGVVT